MTNTASPLAPLSGIHDAHCYLKAMPIHNINYKHCIKRNMSELYRCGTSFPMRWSMQTPTVSVFKAHLDSVWLEIGFVYCEKPIAIA